MEDLLDIIYDKVMQEAGDFSEASRKLECVIRQKSMELDADSGQKVEIREMMYDLLGIAQEAYFKLGFKYGVQLMKETQLKG